MPELLERPAASNPVPVESHEDARIAYFSMEIGIHNAMPTYSGGLGVLAGDTLRSAADLAIPMVGMTLLSRKGYFFQKLSGGHQSEEPVQWPVEDFLQEVRGRVFVGLSGRKVALRAWRYEIKGIGGYVVPVYFLDSDLEENAPDDRILTHYLYGGDQRYRFSQEVLLGMGGIRMLRALGYGRIARYHMNEGHASMLALELLDEHAANAGHEDINHQDIDAVKKQCVFTTHTPVPSGFDQFPIQLVAEVLGRKDVPALKDVFCCDGILNMTFLGLNLSHYINGVAKKHGEISQLMFAQYQVDSITNGIHVAHWACDPMQKLFDQYIPDWRQNNFSLRYALGIPEPEVWSAHATAKSQLIQRVNAATNAGLKDDVFTIGFARRAAGYKRADLFFHDLERLKAIAANAGTFQAVFAGKAHPQDSLGKDMIHRIVEAAGRLKDQIRVVYLPNYDMDLARLITSGSDLWLNTPQPPLEASGTSGMKAAVNGVPSLSVKDGWWVEGHIEGVTGWAIGPEHPQAHDAALDADSMYTKLEMTILPMFYRSRTRFINIMRHAIALNGSFFNTQRMMQQYVLKAYLRT